ncbi:MAG: adenine deaminase [Candidatus Rokubacteria bacterium]|nr:adenine deaminase [Candidatus Rokubacteria bacterium]
MTVSRSRPDTRAHPTVSPARRRWIHERRALTRVARGALPADRYLEGGTLLNVYTGELYPANVAIKGERIAYVGARDDMVGPRTEVLSAAGRILCPGYIEPHAHPWLMATPAALARHVLPLGTTSIVADDLPLYELGGERGFRVAVEALSRGPLKYYWLVRLHSQSRSGGESRRFPTIALARLLASPWVAAAGEVTRWPEAWEGDPALLERLALAAERRRRIEGHTAGASVEKLAGLAAAGLSSCHEAITAREALDRARAGLAVILRQSSLRPDLKELLAALKEAPGLTARVMLTTDGSSPAFVAERGFVDHLVAVAMEAGVPPVDAYRMVTLNPAFHFGLDAEIGGIAAGRYADLLLLRDLSEPRPETVISRGRVVARDQTLLASVPEPPWARIFASRSARLAVRWRVGADDFVLPRRGRQPVIRFVSAVITRLEERSLEPGDLLAALIDREGRWICPGVVAGFCPELDGLATTVSTDFQILVLGRDARAMAAAVNRLLALGGGIVVVEGGRVSYELALPLGGIMSRQPLAVLAERERELFALLKAHGYAHHDPLFTLLFLVADFLPEVRLTARGVWDVKGRKVLAPSRRLARRRGA